MMVVSCAVWCGAVVVVVFVVVVCVCSYVFVCWCAVGCLGQHGCSG